MGRRRSRARPEYVLVREPVEHALVSAGDGPGRRKVETSSSDPSLDSRPDRHLLRLGQQAHSRRSKRPDFCRARIWHRESGLIQKGRKGGRQGLWVVDV